MLTITARRVSEIHRVYFADVCEATRHGRFYKYWIVFTSKYTYTEYCMPLYLLMWTAVHRFCIIIMYMKRSGLMCSWKSVVTACVL